MELHFPLKVYAIHLDELKFKLLKTIKSGNNLIVVIRTWCSEKVRFPEASISPENCRRISFAV
ncbi:MAG: hypothetical protein CME86_01000 [Herbaspirillum sp.]|nr:hypothetical protein [Herbaspirillum sp.]MBO14954.1 hypothetical protein [Herbaspirillum sp.]